jgi:hypothetical protein
MSRYDLVGEVTARILNACGDELTCENVMRQASQPPATMSREAQQSYRRGREKFLAPNVRVRQGGRLRARRIRTPVSGH